ncbi:hypothetical protein [Kitasatospora sp. NPDC059327]
MRMIPAVTWTSSVPTKPFGRHPAGCFVELLETVKISFGWSGPVARVFGA